MKTLRLALVAVVLAGIVWVQARGQSQEETFVLDVEVEVVLVDLEKGEMTFQDLETETPYVGKVDKKTKLKAKKKIFRGKLKLGDFKKGDLVKVKLLPEDSRLLEVELLKRAQGS